MAELEDIYNTIVSIAWENFGNCCTECSHKRTRMIEAIKKYFDDMENERDE